MDHLKELVKDFSDNIIDMDNDMSEIMDDLSRIVHERVQKMNICFNAEEMGLDRRAGHQIYYDNNTIVIPDHYRGSFEYYGAFEYVDKDFVKNIGNYVFYMTDGNETCRVHDAIENIKNHIINTEEKKMKEMIETLIEIKDKGI